MMGQMPDQNMSLVERDELMKAQDDMAKIGGLFSRSLKGALIINCSVKVLTEGWCVFSYQRVVSAVFLALGLIIQTLCLIMIKLNYGSGNLLHSSVLS